jgi:hypothetical protein
MIVNEIMKWFKTTNKLAFLLSGWATLFLVGVLIEAVGYYGGFFYIRVFQQFAFDFPQFDADAVQLDWWSKRPRNSILPLGSQRARSPVL